MKSLVMLFLGLYSVTSSAQQSVSSSCDTQLLTQFDSAREVYVRNVKDDVVLQKDEKNKLTISLLEMEKTIVLTIVVVGAGDCVDETNKMNIVFRDGTKLEMANNGGFNCEAEFSVFFGGDFGHKKELTALLSKEIESIKVATRKSAIDKAKNNTVEVLVSPAVSKTIMESFNCLVR